MAEGAGTAARRTRNIAYWVFTLIVAGEMIVGGFWDLLRIEYVRAVMTHLGYPLYTLFIIGTWKILCGAALLAPRFVLLKEWAYAGAFFNYTGAVASHIAVGDHAGKWAPPLVFALFAVASWALRPASRRLPLRWRPARGPSAGVVDEQVSKLASQRKAKGEDDADQSIFVVQRQL